MRQFSPVFQSLVSDINDIEGIVAYALYKKQKTEFIQNHLEAHSIPPTEKELENFCKTCMTQTALNNYRNTSTNLLTKYNLKTFHFRAQFLLENSELKLSEPESEPDNYMKGVIQSALGSLIFTIVMVLLAIAFSGGDSLKRILQSLVDMM